MSPANKDRRQSVQDFIEKAIGALQAGCHLLIVDLFPPGQHDPRTMHGLVWEYFDPENYEMPAVAPLTLAAYASGDIPEAYVAHLASGEEMPSMPLFLQRAILFERTGGSRRETQGFLTDRSSHD